MMDSKNYPKYSLGWYKELGEKNGIYCNNLCIKDAKRILQDKGILKTDTELNYEYNMQFARSLGYSDYKEYKDSLAQKRGYKNSCDQQNNWRHETGRNFHYIENKDCTLYFGIEIAEKYVSSLFEEPIRMPINNPGYDWLCKNGYKIQHKAACLSCSQGDRGVSYGWNFEVDYNQDTDYFIFSGYKDRNNTEEPIFILLIHKNEIIRDRKLWRRSFLWVNNRRLLEFRKYNITENLKRKMV